MTAARGAAKNMANRGRQSCLGFRVISGWKSPRNGERINQVIASGKNNTAMRGRKDVPVSPCVANPMIVTTAIANMSPATKRRFEPSIL